LASNRKAGYWPVSTLVANLILAVASFTFSLMDESLELLIQIQAGIIECRRIAKELPPEGARVLLEIAEQIEGLARGFG
jgi:hypothetical protein